MQLQRSVFRPAGRADRAVLTRGETEDTDGNGKFHKRTVFIENLNLICGLDLGFGGAWVGAAPYVLFIPIKAGEELTLR